MANERDEADPTRADVVFAHASDELYGADRMLLEILAAVPPDRTVEVWVPTDLEHGPHPLCVELERLGHRVEHVSMPVLRRSYATPCGLLALAARFWPFWRRLRAVRPRELYCVTSATMWCAPVGRLVGVAHITGHVQEMWGRSERATLTLPARSCQRLVAISEAVADRLPSRLRGRTTVVLNATPDPVAGDLPSAPETDLATREGPVRFLVASRWVRAKGLHTLVEAWGLMLASLGSTTSPPHLVVLGGPPPIGESVDVLAAVAALSDPTTVTVLGEVPDIGAEIAAADVVLMPSERPEPFGLIAIEGFARARPVVASRAGGLVEIVSEGRTGWLFEPGDVEGLAALLVRLAGTDHAVLAEASAAARRDYEARFRPERFAADWRAAVLG